MGSIRPLHDKVVVARSEAEKKTAGGIVLPDTAKEKPKQGTVIAVGPGRVLENGEVKAQEIYFTREMQNHHGGIVFVNGYLYGFNNSILTCLEFATGKVVWRHRSVGKGSLSYADGHLYLLSENNVAGMAEATPAGYREKGRFTIADQGWPSWAHPVVAGGRLYLRNQGILTAYNIRGD